MNQRRLIKFKTLYLFDDENGWHGDPGCWIGHHHYNQKLLVLVPAQSSLSKQEQQTFLNYAKEIAEQSNVKKRIEAVIFAFKQDVDKENTEKNTREQGLIDGLYEFTINIFGRDETRGNRFMESTM